MRGWSLATSLSLRLVVSLASCASLACSACAGATSVTAPSSATQVDPGPRHFVSNGYTRASLEGFDLVGYEDSDLHEAEQTRRAVEVELEKTYLRAGHRRWFFYAFDRAHLDFVVARYQPSPLKRPRYVAEHRMRVKRTPDAERSLSIEDTIRQYELGERGVRPGMGRIQVEAKLGKAQREMPLSKGGKVGSFDMLYPSLCVRLVDYRVTNVWQRPRCAVRP